MGEFFFECGEKPNPEEIEAIVSVMRFSGVGFRDICTANGIPDEIIEKWIGLDDVTFSIRKAKSQFVLMMLKRIYEDGGHGGARFLLERSEKLGEKKKGCDEKKKGCDDLFG